MYMHTVSTTSARVHSNVGMKKSWKQGLIQMYILGRLACVIPSLHHILGGTHVIIVACLHMHIFTFLFKPFLHDFGTTIPTSINI